MKPIRFTLAAIHWLCYTASISQASYYTNPNRFNINWQFRPRWWLPFFWLIFLLSIPLFLLDGGLMGWWEELTRRFNPQKRVHYSRSASWLDETPEWRRRLALWYLIFST